MRGVVALTVATSLTLAGCTPSNGRDTDPTVPTAGSTATMAVAPESSTSR